MQTITDAQADDLFLTPPTRWIPVTSGEVAYRRVGSGPDVLFVHGYPVSGGTFRRLLPHLAPHVTCHVIDLLGAGDSRFDRDSDISVAGHIRSVREVADALGLQDVALVGHDSGGLIARHAMAGDERVRSFGLVNTEHPRPHWRFTSFLHATRLPGFERVLAWASGRRWLRRNPFVLGDCFHDRDLIDGMFDTLFLAPLRDNPERRWAAGALPQTFGMDLITALDEVHARIDVPVQLVWGEDDPFFPVDRARAMANSFKDGDIHVVPRAKLFVHEERPEEVARALLPTLRGDRRAGAPATASTS